MPAEPTPELPWTGERLVTSITGDTAIEHLHRYGIARTWATDCDVLDIASGEGYGSHLLAEVARSVIGVDLDPATVAHAAAKYPRPNLRFLAGSATAIPLPDATVDLVVSFETIEHLTEHAEMLRELRRVLRPGGRLIISSPDRREYSDAAHYQNVFHLKELDAAELESLLHRHFPEVQLLGQRVVYGSLLSSAASSTATAPFTTYQGDFQALHAKPGVPRPTYWVALCAATPQPALAPSLFEDSAAGATLAATQVLHVQPETARWWHRWRRPSAAPAALSAEVKLDPELACRVRSFAVTFRGTVRAGTTAVRLLHRDKAYPATLTGETFTVEVNLGTGRHPCIIETTTATAPEWRESHRLRLEVPETTFRAYTRGE